MKNLMIQHQARAITIHCLGGIPIDKLGYPCLGFSKLNDLGLVGACEADMDSTLTMLLFGYAFGKPGFITDPLFDLSKNAMIHAHCLSATKMDGPAGQRAPVHDPHPSRRQPRGVAGRRAARRPGDHLREALQPGDACCSRPRRSSRSPASTTAAAARRSSPGWPTPGRCSPTGAAACWIGTDMMTMLHRVVFYGNHVENVQYLAQLMGLKTVMEG